MTCGVSARPAGAPSFARKRRTGYTVVMYDAKASSYPSFAMVARKIMVSMSGLSPAAAPRLRLAKSTSPPESPSACVVTDDGATPPADSKAAPTAIDSFGTR